MEGIGEDRKRLNVKIPLNPLRLESAFRSLPRRETELINYQRGEKARRLILPPEVASSQGAREHDGLMSDAHGDME